MLWLTSETNEGLRHLVNIFQGEVLPYAISGSPFDYDDPERDGIVYKTHGHFMANNKAYRAQIDRAVDLAKAFERSGVPERLDQLNADEPSLTANLEALRLILSQAPLLIQAHLVNYRLTRMVRPMLERSLR
jgi:hypothetical protein